MSPENNHSHPGPEARLAARLDENAAEFSEVETERAEIEAAGNEIINSHEISAEFFEDQTRSLLFTAIAQRLARKRQSNLAPEALATEEQFISNAVTLLAFDKSGLYEKNKDLIDRENTVVPGERRRLLQEFTDSEFTAELEAAIQNGLLDGVKSRLGISAENEQSYVVHVLKTGDISSLYGLQPYISPEMSSDHNHPDWPEAHKAFDEYREYSKTLEDNSQDLASQLGYSKMPIAFVSDIEGETHLCIPHPVAEKILHKDKKRSVQYSESDAAKDMAILEHEYVHTQGSLLIEGQVFFGIALEERRAEHFSGDKMGYQDVKRFLRDVHVITGLDAVGVLSRETAKDPTNAYKAVAHEIGLQSMLELSLAVPKAYLSGHRPLQMAVSEYQGGLDGPLERLYDQAVEAGKKEDIDKRLDILAAALIGSEIDLEFWSGYTKSALGLNFITDMTMEKIKEKQSAAVESSAG